MGAPDAGVGSGVVGSGVVGASVGCSVGDAEGTVGICVGTSVVHTAGVNLHVMPDLRQPETGMQSNPAGGNKLGLLVRSMEVTP